MQGVVCVLTCLVGFTGNPDKQLDLRNSGKERATRQSQVPIVRRRGFDAQKPWGFNGLAWFEIGFFYRIPALFL